MKMVIYAMALLFLAGCAQTGYQGSYVITHNSEEDSHQTATP